MANILLIDDDNAMRSVMRRALEHAGQAPSAVAVALGVRVDAEVGLLAAIADRLAASGIVVLTPERGAEVRKLSIKEAIDTLVVVQGLIGIAARLDALNCALRAPNVAVHLRRTERPQGARPAGGCNGLFCVRIEWLALCTGRLARAQSS